MQADPVFLAILPLFQDDTIATLESHVLGNPHFVEFAEYFRTKMTNDSSNACWNSSFATISTDNDYLHGDWDGSVFDWFTSVAQASDTELDNLLALHRIRLIQLVFLWFYKVVRELYDTNSPVTLGSRNIDFDLLNTVLNSLSEISFTSWDIPPNISDYINQIDGIRKTFQKAIHDQSIAKIDELGVALNQAIQDRDEKQVAQLMLKLLGIYCIEHFEINTNGVELADKSSALESWFNSIVRKYWEQIASLLETELIKKGVTSTELFATNVEGGVLDLIQVFESITKSLIERDSKS